MTKRKFNIQDLHMFKTEIENCLNNGKKLQIEYNDKTGDIYIGIIYTKKIKKQITK